MPGDAIDTLFRPRQLKLDAAEEAAIANEYVLLKDQTDESHTALSRYRADLNALVPVRPRRGPVFGIMPRNVQQTMALDLLLDDSVKLVSLIGDGGDGQDAAGDRGGDDQGAERAGLPEAAGGAADHAAGARHRLSAGRQGREADGVDAADLRQHGYLLSTAWPAAAAKRPDDARVAFDGRAADQAADGDRGRWCWSR